MGEIYKEGCQLHYLISLDHKESLPFIASKSNQFLLLIWSCLSHSFSSDSTMRSKSSENAKLMHKKGLWSPDEDQKLKDYIVNHGLGCWSAVPIQAGKFITFTIIWIWKSFKDSIFLLYSGKNHKSFDQFWQITIFLPLKSQSFDNFFEFCIDFFLTNHNLLTIFLSSA